MRDCSRAVVSDLVSHCLVFYGIFGRGNKQLPHNHHIFGSDRVLPDALHIFVLSRTERSEARQRVDVHELSWVVVWSVLDGRAVGIRIPGFLARPVFRTVNIVSTFFVRLRFCVSTDFQDERR